MQATSPHWKFRSMVNSRKPVRRIPMRQRPRHLQRSDRCPAVASVEQSSPSSYALRRLNPLQIKSLRRRGRPRRPPVLRRQHLQHLPRAKTPEPHFHQRPHDDPHHVPQKPAPLDPQHQSRRPKTHPAIPHNRRTVFSRPCPGLAKLAKSCSPSKCAAASAIAATSSFLPSMPRQLREKQRPVQRVPDHILIPLRPRRGHRIKRFRHRLDRAESACPRESARSPPAVGHPSESASDRYRSAPIAPWHAPPHPCATSRKA